MNMVYKSFKTKLSSKYLGSLQSCPSYFALTTLQINSLLHSGSYIASSSRKSIWCSQSFQTSLPWCTQRGWKSNSLFVWDKTEKDMEKQHRTHLPTINVWKQSCATNMPGNNCVQCGRQPFLAWYSSVLSALSTEKHSVASGHIRKE